MGNLSFIDSIYATQNFAKDIRRAFNDKNHKSLTEQMASIISKYQSAKKETLPLPYLRFLRLIVLRLNPSN